MYKEFYGFSEKPFSMTPDTRFFYRSRKHEDALATLLYTIAERKGFAVVTGEIGAGKTTICRALLNQLDDNTKTAVITNTHLTGKQLIKLVMDDLRVRGKNGSKVDLLVKFNQFLIEQLSLGQNVVLIIDEAQNLRPSVLEEVRMLSNLETEKEKLVQIILVGQPQLRKKLDLRELEQLRQRINVHYHLGALSEGEVIEYVNHRLSIVNANGTNGGVKFGEEALTEIYHGSRGIPRLINIICDHALLTGYVRETREITAEIIKEVVAELP